MASRFYECDVVIIGSGPGGAVIAEKLSSNGVNVLVIEEGLPLHDQRPFSSKEMDAGYKYAGLRAFLGSGLPVLAEAKCLGGGSEINAGIYYRSPIEVLESWQETIKDKGYTYESLEPHFRRIEKNLSISKNIHGPSLMTEALIDAADALGYSYTELQRWVQSEPRSSTWTSYKRYGMVNTYIRESIRGGAKILIGTKAQRLITKSGRVVLLECSGENKERIVVSAKDYFICCGATSTPALLRRSGIKVRPESGLRIHQMVKILAKYPYTINQDCAGVPALQITEFTPRLTIGASYSSTALMSMMMPLKDINKLLEHKDRYHILYALVPSNSTGMTLSIPGLDEVTFYGQSKADDLAIRYAAKSLLDVIGATGVEEVYISDRKFGGIRFDDVKSAQAFADSKSFKPDITSIHAFSSCRMGSQRSKSTCDTNGKIFDLENAYIADSSVLPGSTGVNPQGTIMAFSSVIAERYLKVRHSFV